MPELFNDRIGIDIIDVTSENFDAQFECMLNIVEQYKYVTIDTEFPGIVLEPVEQQDSLSAWNYLQMRANVNALKIIQLGITFSNDIGDEKDSPPQTSPCWQFNFEFDLQSDIYAGDAIDLLKSAGLDFDKHSVQGIRAEEFGERLTTSGLVLSEDFQWISFHGLYDFGYLLKVLTGAPLPEDIGGFFDQLDMYFPKRCDIKFLMREEFKGGLSSLGAELGLQRTGTAHQGGSDSILTAQVYFSLNPDIRGRAFDAHHPDAGGLFGLSNDERHDYHRYGGASRNRSRRSSTSRSPRERSPASLTPTMSHDFMPLYASNGDIKSHGLMDSGLGSPIHGDMAVAANGHIDGTPAVPMPMVPPPPPPGGAVPGAY
mmetsp:Transcript_39511/g.86179  ORF Transcript_39511/g.86179 Transcript_39511/m.86179 type:complete len:372 (+) Transcript_39511:59-1174(+)|eukprot:CAMPEP_0204370432 /NCGR_PEP_ID=MMETSP0469-20131031/45729_1 /ASSEMBLY_ACC=CAM_ASM_000384 /TAXON_ID=2969 /ORGANISM="Oxyrrhis marina" /LENGTH=371 /DNA_ID=CAMNT_0051360353 /DNA_START=67 /DNA_END=1182 /DNA_ORIENTATION=-